MSMITSSHLLCRMEAAHRQTRGNLDRIERQISARAERMTMTAKAKARSHPRGGSRWTRSDEALFRVHIDALNFERRGEIDALTRKLIRQERAIAAVSVKPADDQSGTKADTQPIL
ncbi:hypothetical protein [Hoeflea alexandrii]|uniref:hypothetical protein n=1 Tax=Hoeflea alexandrii TaxID=288436 RepID=UPI0022AEBCE9|nr:hypothetical protein [Hoeflea alexandrii]MCZ4292003.1 hypothetical protein [Hoeflea alexandrii]